MASSGRETVTTRISKSCDSPETKVTGTFFRLKAAPNAARLRSRSPVLLSRLTIAMIQSGSSSSVLPTLTSTQAQAAEDTRTEIYRDLDDESVPLTTTSFSCWHSRRIFPMRTSQSGSALAQRQVHTQFRGTPQTPNQSHQYSKLFSFVTARRACGV